MKKGETKGNDAQRVRIEKERLRELATLTGPQRTTLRYAILTGMSDYDAAAKADCPNHVAETMRARLKSLDLVPPLPTKPRPRKIVVDPRQMSLLDEI